METSYTIFGDEFVLKRMYNDAHHIVHTLSDQSISGAIETTISKESIHNYMLQIEHNSSMLSHHMLKVYVVMYKLILLNNWYKINLMIFNGTSATRRHGFMFNSSDKEYCIGVRTRLIQNLFRDKIGDGSSTLEYQPTGYPEARRYKVDFTLNEECSKAITDFSKLPIDEWDINNLLIEKRVILYDIIHHSRGKEHFGSLSFEDWVFDAEIVEESE